jgi:subtilase family serine protease
MTALGVLALSAPAQALPAGEVDPTPPPPQPDLTVTGWIGESTVQLALMVYVKNIGNTAAGTFVVDIRYGLDEKVVNVGGLDPGATVDLGFWTDKPPCTLTLTATADPYHRVVEKVESNNVLQRTWRSNTIQCR